MNSKALKICILLSTFYCCNLVAQGIGDFAATVAQPIGVITQLVQAVSIICGSGLVLGGILKYTEYRKNPVAVRLGSVFFMFIFGGALIIVGLIR